VPDPDRVAKLIVLVEDAEQQTLVRRYLERCGHGTTWCDFRPLPAGRGSGEKYVRDEYPRQVQACRSAVGRRASALLVVVVDADSETTQRRGAQLAASLQAAEIEERPADDPNVVVLITKRHVETWIRALRATL
jgi:hypothetical protein